MADTSTPPTIDWTIRDVYNAYMLEHEPELLPEMLPLLPYLYDGATEEERHERDTRYDRVLKEFELFLPQLKKIWIAKLRDFQKKFPASLRSPIFPNEGSGSLLRAVERAAEQS